MPCLIGCLAFAFPRVALLLVAVFSNFLSRAYGTWLWPVLGFFFMPLTTLAYAWGVNSNNHSVDGIYLVVVVLAVLADLGLLGGSGYSGRRYRRRRVG
jgi:hypothetical protein